MNKRTLRPAIAMIELIFAIVIMGIVLMTVPMLIRTAAKSGYVATQQEGINEAASKMNMLMGYPWDESNVDNSTYNTILRTNSNVSELSESNKTVNGNIVEGYRKGTPIESLRNFKAPGNTRLNASLSVDGEDDIDDFSGTIIHLSDTSSGAATADYIEKTSNINISTTVAYINDSLNSGTYTVPNTGGVVTYSPNFAALPSGSTNIKSISVVLTSNSDINELDKTIIMHAFSCNIGGYKLEEKDF